MKKVDIRVNAGIYMMSVAQMKDDADNDPFRKGICSLSSSKNNAFVYVNNT